MQRFSVLGILSLSACAPTFSPDAGDEVRGAEARGDAATTSSPDAGDAVGGTEARGPAAATSSSTATTPAGSLTQDELDVLNALGLGLPASIDDIEVGLGDVVVTPASGLPIDLEGLAIQWQSDDRFYDNTLVFAWSGLDVAAGTADTLLRFRAAGLAAPGDLPLDALSNAMLPSWVLFSDATADATYYADDGTLSIDAVSLDASTEVDCSGGSETATCSTGTVEGEIDMSTLGYDGFGANYRAPANRGVSTSALDVSITFDVPVQRTSFER